MRFVVVAELFFNVWKTWRRNLMELNSYLKMSAWIYKRWILKEPCFKAYWALKTTLVCSFWFLWLFTRKMCLWKEKEHAVLSIFMAASLECLYPWSTGFYWPLSMDLESLNWEIQARTSLPVSLMGVVWSSVREMNTEEMIKYKSNSTNIYICLFFNMRGLWALNLSFLDEV